MPLLYSHTGGATKLQKAPEGPCGAFAASVTPLVAGPVTLKVDGLLLGPGASCPKGAMVIEIVSAEPEPEPEAETEAEET